MTNVFLRDFIGVPQILEERINKRIAKETPEFLQIYPGAWFRITGLTSVCGLMVDRDGETLWARGDRDADLIEKVNTIVGDEMICTIDELHYLENRKPIWSEPLQAEKDLLELQEEIDTIVGLANKLLQVKIEFIGWQAEHRMLQRFETKDRLLWCLGQMGMGSR